ncbi:hypothetical protein DFJ73DRAFT_798419, partial [Zopfochytrium polystomum]
MTARSSSASSFWSRGLGLFIALVLLLSALASVAFAAPPKGGGGGGGGSKGAGSGFISVSPSRLRESARPLASAGFPLLESVLRRSRASPRQTEAVEEKVEGGTTKG